MLVLGTDIVGSWKNGLRTPAADILGDDIIAPLLNRIITGRSSKIIPDNDDDAAKTDVKLANEVEKSRWTSLIR